MALSQSTNSNSRSGASQVDLDRNCRPDLGRRHNRGQRQRCLLEGLGQRLPKSAHADIGAVREVLPPRFCLRSRQPFRSYSQFVLSHQPDGARLRAFFPHLFRIGHVRIDGQMRKLSVEHAVPVEIDLAAIVRFDEAELAKRIELDHRPDRRTIVVLHLPLQFANLILQLPTRALESVINCEG